LKFYYRENWCLRDLQIIDMKFTLLGIWSACIWVTRQRFPQAEKLWTADHLLRRLYIRRSPVPESSGQPSACHLQQQLLRPGNREDPDTYNGGRKRNTKGGLRLLLRMSRVLEDSCNVRPVKRQEVFFIIQIHFWHRQIAQRVKPFSTGLQMLVRVVESLRGTY